MRGLYLQHTLHATPVLESIFPTLPIGLREVSRVGKQKTTAMFISMLYSSVEDRRRRRRRNEVVDDCPLAELYQRATTAGTTGATDRWRAAASAADAAA